MVAQGDSWKKKQYFAKQCEYRNHISRLDITKEYPTK